MHRNSARSHSRSNRRAAAKSRRRNRRSSNRSVSALLEPVTRHNRRDALAFVAARPFENAHLHAVLDGGFGRFAGSELLLDRRRDGSVRGLAAITNQLVVAGEDPLALDAFAVVLRKYPMLRSFVGPKRAIDGLWARVKGWHRAPRFARERQPIYALWPSGLRPGDDGVPVRLARSEDAALVAEHSAQMILGELGYDPRAERASYIASVRRAIAAGLWWVWIEDGDVRFQCNVGARTPITVQLQGVWTPPHQRGHGYATRALAGIARAVLVDVPTASLYVNDFNAPAIALYERVGFVRVGEVSTLLFG